MWNAAERSDKIRTDCLLNLLKKKKKRSLNLERNFNYLVGAEVILQDVKV